MSVSNAPEQGLGRGAGTGAGRGGAGAGSPLLATRQHLAYTPSSSAASSRQQQQQQQQQGYTSAYTPISTNNNPSHARAATGTRLGYDSIGAGPSSSPYVPGTYSSNYHHQNQPIPTINAINNKGGRRIPGTSTPMGSSHHNHGQGGSGRGSGTRKVFGHPL